MSKVLKRLYLGDVVKSFGTKQLRKLTTEEPTESIVGTWVYNSNGVAPSGLGVFNINTKLNDSDTINTQFAVGYIIDSGTFTPTENKTCIYSDPNLGINVISSYFTGYGIHILGGADITNETFKTWLKANATKQ